ncbi:IS1595 family transposase [Telluria aromaticivorans]|uniref:IS1595 family transposase n=1 Tax=Telluria aromaticivorans TaxID=2725995 RepID=A0A7Y2NZM1_9BURK|nr:IS1595 family transposase [Telluria aromaticivorans]NNG23229.1 IS1595 family transposase [Telluria aromaticivorans]
MNRAGFTRWLRKLPSLTQRQRTQVLDALRPAIGFERVCAAIADAKPLPCCPTCRAERPYRHGQDRGVQRYRCRACGKTFSALSGTPLSRLRHRAKWLDYLEKMLDTKSVRASADAVGVHRNTSFRWRHRFLTLAKHDRPERLAGIAEADEMFLLESQKGSRSLDRPARRRGGVAATRGITHEHVCILVARDRTRQTRDFVTGRAAVTKEQLQRHLLPVLDKDVLLVTDGHAAYRAFAREAGIAHAFVNLRLGERVRGAVHVQNVNAYHQRFRQWLARFHGVASHYLPNYLGWRWALDGERIASPERLLRAALGSFNT